MSVAAASTVDPARAAEDRGYGGPGAVGEVPACAPATSAASARGEVLAAAASPPDDGDDAGGNATDEAIANDADDPPPSRRAPPKLDVDTVRGRLGGCRTKKIDRLLTRVSGSDDAGEGATLEDHGPRTILRLSAAGNGVYGGWSEEYVAARCERDHPLPAKLELSGDSLRIRRPDDTWIELPIAVLASATAD